MADILSQNETMATGGAGADGRTAGQSIITWHGFAQLAISPTAWTVAFVTLICLALLFPVSLPIGSYYWDVTLYADAAWRINSGQMPNVDFFTPAGPLEYYAFAVLESIFPNGNLVLLSNWSIQLVALPLMIATMHHAGRPNRNIALALLLPFIFFAFAPLNTTETYPLPGVDGFGIYNRHTALLMYVLLCCILFVRNASAQILLLSALMLALFFTKITGFAIGLGLITHGVVAGRIDRRTLWFAAIGTGAGILAVEISIGIVSAYLNDIMTLLTLNQSDVLETLRKPLNGYPATIAAVIAMAAFLLWERRILVGGLLSYKTGIPFWRRIQSAANLESTWLLSILLATIVFESQNTGSLEYVLLWPLVIAIAADRWPNYSATNLVAGGLALIILAPFITGQANRMVRAAAVSLTYQKPNLPETGKLGLIMVKPDLIKRSATMSKHYADNKGAYDKLVSANQDQSYLLNAEPGFQLVWLKNINEAVQAIRTYENKNNLRMRQILTLDFVDPLPALLGRTPVRLVSIGRMEGRTVPPLTGERLKAAHMADAFLVPRCPATQTVHYLVTLFQPVLSQRKKVSLTPCWDMYIRPQMAH
ncbi:MAG: hypothetical protein NWT00_00110 [Beijerinckiaceae bacterium]|jgi:hypothetical protein|nr:hypothetical protein [Beijerinckiaceae bacterium]